MIRTYKTDLHCDSCLTKIQPVFDREPSIISWQADVHHPDKLLTVQGDKVSTEQVNRLLHQAGFHVLAEVAPTTSAQDTPSSEPPKSFYPLLLILGYVLGVTLLVELPSGEFQLMRFMNHFMAGFFLVFSFFKLLDVSAFADAYSSYDILAKRSRLYALAYPFIELALGLSYLIGWQPTATNLATLLVMGLGTIGVVQTLWSGRTIRCACLGTVFNLPMTFVTLVEDVLMVVMALAMLLMS